MADDTMVAELFLRLRFSASPPPPKPLEWSVRQRRSKHPTASVNPRKLAPRASPTTPLSWSFATSLSGGFGGVGDEESSRPTSRKLGSKDPDLENSDGDGFESAFHGTELGEGAEGDEE